MSRGSVSAYHASDGSPAFRFFTAPAPGEIGGQTWPAGPLGFSTGGATVWNTPAVDPAQNMIVFSTGNAAPWTGRGPGQNLFTSSMVALDATTGQVRWWYQMVHHDLWDYDCPNAPIMFDVTIAGVNRHADRRGMQDRLALHARPHERPAAARDQGDQGAAAEGAEHLADAADPDR